MAEGVVDDISNEGLRVLLRQEGVTFQRLKTWKASKDPRYAAKKARIEHLYAITDRDVAPSGITTTPTTNGSAASSTGPT